jgi:hypothetical protein
MQFKNPVLFVYKTSVSESKYNEENSPIKSGSVHLKETYYDLKNLKGVVFTYSLPGEVKIFRSYWEGNNVFFFQKINNQQSTKKYTFISKKSKKHTIFGPGGGGGGPC